MNKAVIFDLDGTLLDTLDDLADSFNRVLMSRGLPIHPTEAYRGFVGNGAAKLVSRALPPDKRDDGFAEDCLAAFREEYRNSWNRKTRPYDGIPGLLAGLGEMQVGMAVLTNKPQHFAELCVQEYFSSSTFAVVLGQREGVPMKPHPAGPREVARHLNLRCEECIYVGDSDVDMKTAVGASMLPVGVAWGYRAEQELLEHGAAVVIERPCDLIELLEGN